MKLEDFQFELRQLPGAVAAWHGRVDAQQWRTACQQVRDKGGRLVALWGTDDHDRGEAFAVHAALVVQSGLLVTTMSLDGLSFPDISDIFPAANRMQRAIYDLFGVNAENAADRRKWLRHAAWPADVFPLRKDFVTHHLPGATGNGEADNYPFVRVGGEGVHEIPVGPVHAGTIEPGHFRFSIVGEGILRLEERLAYKHKGIEKRFEGMTLAEGVRLAGRVSGDSTVAYSWAYSMAVESMAEITPPPRALWLRALLLERERIANHLGDLGFLGNDAALAFGLAQFLRLKEDCLRTHQALFGHRYLMDVIVPGGIARDLEPAGMERLRREMAALEQTVSLLKSIYDEHAGLQDRFINCGRVSRELADRLGLTGVAARASGQAWDMRVEYPCVPYTELEVRMGSHRNGDVAARVAVRFEEVFESLRLSRLILDRLPLGACATKVPGVPAGRFGVGWIEGWRGEVLVALETGDDGRVARCHPHDPSWQNWPILERAVLGNIVPDFPLINKSFNLSYSGHDL
ncbi:MAG: hydrogenase [Betaproteobacteria bacterium RIFCSPLOWO2_02_64_14]|nr:MAG: hydrogenase [Betaproteobacteria bacterium RIFCSPLOWO2_02_64_14]